MRLGRRILNGILRFIAAVLNIPIRLKFVILALLLVAGGVYWQTHRSMLEAVGGQSDYDEAMRYIEIKDVVDERFIDPVDRSTLGDNAAAAIIAGLGDKWSYYMSPNEYKAYQLSSTNEYSGIGMAILKTEDGGFEVISVNMDSPAAAAEGSTTRSSSTATLLPTRTAGKSPDSSDPVGCVSNISLTIC